MFDIIILTINQCTLLTYCHKSYAKNFFSQIYILKNNFIKIRKGDVYLGNRNTLIKLQQNQRQLKYSTQQYCTCMYSMKIYVLHNHT